MGRGEWGQGSGGGGATGSRLRVVSVPRYAWLLIMSRRFEAILCDIDGCLIPESGAPLNAEAFVRLAAHNRRAIAAGDLPVITLCSGRPQPFVEALCRLMSNTVCPAISEMGVWLFDPVSERAMMDPAILSAHKDGVRGATRWIEEHLVPRGIFVQPGKAASISLWHPETQVVMDLMPTLVEVFAREGWPLRVSRTVQWVNCDLAHISKGTGIERLLAKTGLKPGQLAGIGDTPTDLAIRDRVAFFACPSNAAPELKAKADYVSPFKEMEGVLDILARMTM